MLWLAVGLAALAALLLAVSFAFHDSADPSRLALSQGLRDPAWFALLGGLVLGAVAYAFRPRRADAPSTVEPEWFPDSTEFARSTMMPPQEPARAERHAAASRWSPQVFDAIEWRRVEALCAEVFAGSGDMPSPEALAAARESGLGAADRDRLLARVAQLPPERQQALLARAYEGEYWRPTCPSCGQKMVSHSARRGDKEAWGCADFPRCRATLPMRA
jgi:hypothetical protein